jgi:hypothetical protein
VSDRLDEHAVHVVLGDVADEAPVDLHEVERQLLERQEGAERHPEVVEGQQAPQVVEAAREHAGGGRVGDRRALGDLEDELPGRQADGLQPLDDQPARRRVVDRGGRDVDRQRSISVMRPKRSASGRKAPGGQSRPSSGRRSRSSCAHVRPLARSTIGWL